MSTNPQSPRTLTDEESRAALEDLWGPRPDAAEQDRADAWARRALGIPAESGDHERLVAVDARISTRYGRSVRRAS